MGILKDLAEKVFRKMPLGDIIIFESVPDLSDSTNCVFEEMINRKLNDKYKMIWWINNDGTTSHKKIKNVKYIKYNGIFNKIRFLFYRERAKCIVECNRFLISTRKGQVSTYIVHGTPLKSTRSYYTVPHEIDHVVVASEEAAKICAYEFNYPIDRIHSLGLPRNDELKKKKIQLSPLFSKEYNKIIVWYPTYRQHKTSKNIYNGSALPIIHNVEQAKKLDSIAKELNVLIVLKPHFAQDISYVKDMNLANIRFIDDKFFVENHISSYEFVGNCDALITDYSSIYFDYTLCNKPIALVLEDIELYKEDTGLIEKFDECIRGASKIEVLDDLICFVQSVAEGRDELQKERNEICNLFNSSEAENSTTKVTDFIIKQAGL